MDLLIFVFLTLDPILRNRISGCLLSKLSLLACLLFSEVVVAKELTSGEIL